MSTTRIIFIIVCLAVAVIVFTIGILIQKNDPDSKYSLKSALNPRSARKGKNNDEFNSKRNHARNRINSVVAACLCS